MKQVLIVDDNDRFANFMAWKLDPAFRVRRCANIIDALGVIVGGSRFDIILCRTHCGGPFGGKVFWKRLQDECEEQAAKVVLYSTVDPPAGRPS